MSASRLPIDWILPMLAVVAAVTYNNWLLGRWLNPVLLRADGSISEYSSMTQPHHLVFQILDIASGLLLIGLGAAAIRLLPGRRSTKWLAIGTIIFGVSNIADALFVLPCSEALSPTCRVPVSISLHTYQVPNHAYSSVVIGLCYLALPLIGLYIAYRRRMKLAFGASFLAVTAALVSFFLVISQYVNDDSLSVKASGSSQQIQMLIIAAWIVVIYWSLNQAHFENKQPTS